MEPATLMQPIERISLCTSDSASAICDRPGICCADSTRIVLLHVRGEMNKLADRLANRGIDELSNTKVRAKVDQAIALRAHTRGEESPDSSGQGGR